MNLEVASTGGSHGPARVAIVFGLLAGLVLDKTARGSHHAPFTTRPNYGQSTVMGLL